MLGTPGLNPAQLNYIDIYGTGNKVTEASAVAVSCCKSRVALGRRVALELPWATLCTTCSANLTQSKQMQQFLHHTNERKVLAFLHYDNKCGNREAQHWDSKEVTRYILKGFLSPQDAL